MSKKTYDSSMINSFPKQFKMELPDGYRIDIDYDEDGEQIATLRGGFSFNDEGEETAEFSAAFITMNSTIEDRESLIEQGKLKDHFVPGLMLEQAAVGVMEQLQEQFGPGTRFNMYDSYPASVVMKFYKPFSIFGVTLESYVVMYLVEVTENLFFGFNTVYQNNEDGNDVFYRHLFNVIKSIHVNSKPVDTGNLTAGTLEVALDMDPVDDVEAINIGASIGINIQNGDEETRFTLNSDGSISEETVPLSDEDELTDEDDPDDFKDDDQDTDGILDTLRIGESYERSFLKEYGKDIKRMIATGYGYVNYITLSECPNVEEFIVDNNSVFSFADGVLYSSRGGKRTIEYVTKNVKHLHIDADVTDVSSYWHGVEEVTVDPKNSTFTVQGNMLLSRRKNTLYFVTSGAEEVIIPEGVTQIHCRAFQYCDNLKKVVFPASYEWDGWHAANSDPILITPDNIKDAEIIVNGDRVTYENEMVVTSMGYRPEPKLYLGNRKLCRIPANMTSTFGFNQAFAYVENFEVSKDNPALSSSDGVILDKTGAKLVFYPKARKDFIIPKAVKTIDQHSVSYCDGLTEIVIPDHVESIGQMAFSNCTCLRKVTTLNRNIDVHNDAYFGCHLLNGDGFAEPVDEEELKKSVAKEIREIRRSNKRNKDSGSGLGNGLFGLGSLFAEPADKAVRISDDDERKVIVDDKWSFRLPEGLELRFDSEHVDITGSTTTANYVIEGLEYNGRFFFDFELRERFEDGMSTDVDVIGCRHDSSVTSGSAHQKIIKDDDELYVDLISKPVFFFNSMASIRVRGDSIRSWDFTAGLKSTDEEMSARWEEVNALMDELARSIELLEATGESKKKKKKTETGSDPDFIITDGVLRKYIGDKKNIVIPDGVKEIADSTFSGYSKIKTVTVPEGVKRIGRRCFENCLSLRNCYLPDSLEELGGYAFVDCHELKEVYLSEKLKVLGDSAFSECFKLKDVKLPKNIDIIDAFVFKNCKEFRHIVLPEKVTKIGFSAFAGCDNLEYLYVPKSVNECQINLRAHPFEGSNKLTIYTPAGSYAQEFAEEHGIPYENAAKGKVTADNIRVKTGAEGTHSASVAPEKGSGNFAYATPDESLTPHYDSKPSQQGVNFFGINIISNPSGSDYEFYQLAERIDEDASDELKEAVAKLNDTGAANYKLADKAVEMRSVFHVSPDIFDFRHDRECELAHNLMQKAYMMSALRSFAWTLSKYCEDHNTKPADISLGQIQGMINFIADRDWLNYDGLSYCKALCGTSDVHVYYLPDKTPKDVRAVFDTSEQEQEEARKMKEQFPSYNPIFSQIGSLDGLRKELEYIYPAIEKIYEDLAAGRDHSEPLTGNDSDILYAWCALAYAARAPFFSEDGPTMYMHSQIKSEEELQAEYEARRRKAIEERAEMSKQFMASYGKYFEKNPKIVFADKKFVFTGLKARVFEIDDDTNYKQLIEDRGGLTRKSVSGVTDYLVVDPAGAGDSKITTAIENQKNGKPVKIILLDELRSALGLETSEVQTEHSAASSIAAENSAAKPKQAEKTTAASMQTAKPASGEKRKPKSVAAEANDEKTVTVDNDWVVTVPAGFKYSTDKKKIGDHRNIIILEDKKENTYDDPFGASISFTSAFNRAEGGNPAPLVAKMMTNLIFGGNTNVLRDDEEMYLVYYYEPDRSEDDDDEKLDIYTIRLGCGKGVSSIQVFFNNSTQSRREQTRLVEKVAKSIRLASDTKSEAKSTASSTSVLTPEQQRQKEYLESQMDDLKAQAAFYSSQNLDADDRQTLAEAKEGIEKIGKQIDEISTDQAKFGEYLKQKAEKEREQEEERQRKLAEAKAAGKTEDDMINMYVILCNEKKLNSQWEKTQKEFYEKYKDYFPGYKTRELGDLRKEVKEKIKDKEIRRYYAESFLMRSVKDRYDVVTDSYYSLDCYADYLLRSEDAIIKTSEWYTPEEMPEVRKLMDEQHKTDCKNADDAFDPVEKKWKKYWSAKEFLKIVVRDDSDDIRGDCRLFQTKVGLGFLGTVIVEVSLSTKGLLQLSTPVMNFFPFYWDTTTKDIWEAARKNEIVDNSTIYIDDLNDIVRRAIRMIGEKNKESYPDYKTTLNGWNSAISRNASGFAGYIAGLYSNINQHFTAAEIKDKLKSYFVTPYDLAEAKEKLFQQAKRDGLKLLAEILSEHSAIKDIYDSIPKSLAEDIKEVRKEKIQEANEKSYAEAMKFYESNDLKDLAKAEEMFAALGSFKDAKAMLKQCAAKIEPIKAARYDEAISLKKEGTEASVLRAIDILTGLGSYKDAQERVRDYKNDLERRRRLEEIKTLSQSESMSDLKKAITMLEEYKADSPNAEALINQCTAKLDKIKEESYTQAIALAEEGKEESINSALRKLEAISPYKDTSSKMIDLHKLLEKEKQYSKAVSSMAGTNIGELISAQGTFEKLADYKDSSSKAGECEKRIEELRENLYKEARESEKVPTLESQYKAIADYNVLGLYKDAFDRKKKCADNCAVIQKIDELNKEVDDHKKQLSAITGAFKGKERKSIESLIKAKETHLSELKNSLSGVTFVSDVEGYAQNTTGENKAGETPQTQGTAGKKKRGRTLLVILLALLIAAAAFILYTLLWVDSIYTGNESFKQDEVHSLSYQVPKDWEYLNGYSNNSTRVFRLKDGNETIGVLEVVYKGDTDLDGDAGYDYDTAEHGNTTSAVNQLKNPEGFYRMITAGESEFEVTVFCNKGALGVDDFLDAVSDSFETDNYTNPRVLSEMEINYSGSTEAGAVIAKEDLVVTAIYDVGARRGRIQLTKYEWELKEPITLKAGKTSTITVIANGKEFSAEIECTTPADEDTEDSDAAEDSGAEDNSDSADSGDDSDGAAGRSNGVLPKR